VVRKDKYVGFIAQNAENHLVNYPTPVNFSYFWSFGSLIGLILGVQILTGLFLAMNYTPNIDIAFESVNHIMRNVSAGWFFRYLHANGASMIFILIYIHMARGMYYQSYKNPRNHVWNSGVLIFILMAGTSFLGYVLPWGQMSYWGATVITNILSAVPILGEPLVTWIWGGFSVNNATLNRFFALHFVLPFIIAALAIFHIVLLHQVGSSNPLGIDLSVDFIRFTPYFFWKDAVGFLFFILFYIFIALYKPDIFGHPDNYIKANAMVTPTHIVPEWYFLPYYAILKSIPDKLGGAIAMGASMAFLFLLPLIDTSKYSYVKCKFMHEISFYIFVLTVLLLGWLGGRAPTGIIVTFNQILTFYYFFHLLVIIPGLSLLNDYYFETELDQKNDNNKQ
jgi:quinol-cytochrome oxidoreductase complex cytochrome b subunit